jgi:hypothetical protein
MNHLFSTSFLYNQTEQTFSIYKLADNLFQARSESQVMVLWKNDLKWEGAGNTEEEPLIELIGAAIDKHLSAIGSITEN